MKSLKKLRYFFAVPKPGKNKNRSRYRNTDPAQTDFHSLRDSTSKEVNEQEQIQEEKEWSVIYR